MCGQTVIVKRFHRHVERAYLGVQVCLILDITLWQGTPRHVCGATKFVEWVILGHRGRPAPVRSDIVKVRWVIEVECFPPSKNRIIVFEELSGQGNDLRLARVADVVFEIEDTAGIGADPTHEGRPAGSAYSNLKNKKMN